MVKARPIWHPASPRSAYFRLSVTVSAGSKDGRLRCACSGAFQLALDGVRLDGGPAGRQTERSVWWTFGLPLSGRGGDHELTVLAVADDADELPWFLCEGQLATSPLLSGASWQVMAGPARSHPFQERHSALEDPRFREQSPAGGGRWQTAAVVAVDAAPLTCELRAALEFEVRPVGLAAYGEVKTSGAIQFWRNPAPMDRCKWVHPDGLVGKGKARALVGTPDAERGAYLVLDFGRVVTGRPRLRLRADEPGGVIDLGYSLTEGEIQERGRYLCDAGRQEWTAIYPQVCRYVALRLSQFRSPVEVDEVCLVSRQAEVDCPASSAIATGFDGAVWDLGAPSLEAVRQEIYWTQPGTASYDWLHALPLSLNDYCHTGDTTTARAMLATADMEEVSSEDFPRLLAFPLFAQAYYLYSGDRSTAVEALSPMRRILEGASRSQPGCIRPGDALRSGLPGWSTTAFNALWSGALQAGAWLCAQLGDAEGERRWQRERQEVRRALQAAWSEPAYLFADAPATDGEEPSFSQWANALALLYVELSEEQRAGIATAMHKSEVRAPSCLLESFYVADGLWCAGDSGRAVELMRRDWGHLAEPPGQTWCDQSGGIDVAAPGPDYFLASRLLGVRPLAPGYRQLEIRPPQGAVERASGHLWTGRGAVQLEWWQWEGLTTLEVDLKETRETHIAMPRGRAKFPSVTVNGETVWRNEKVHPNATVREVVSEPDHIVLILRESGHFRVVVTRV